MEDFKIEQDLLKAIENDNLVIFVGSGLSKEYHFPDWKSLIFNMLDELAADDDHYNVLKYTLENNVLDEIDVLDKMLDHNPQIKRNIYQSLEKAIDVELPKNDSIIHKKLGDLSSNIITSNYDRVLESALPSFKKISNDKHHIANLNEYEQYIFKIHGCIDSPTECVLFRKDYEDLYYDSAKLARFQSIITDKTILFIGFSFQDRYVRNTFKYIQKLFSNLSRKHYIITTNEESLTEYGISPVRINSWEELPLLLDELITYKNYSFNKPAPVIAHAEGLNDEKNLFKVGILYANPIDVEQFYNIDSILKYFGKYKIEIEIFRLSEESLNDLDDIDYLFLFTKTINGKVIIEDRYFKRKLISINEFEDYLYLPEVRGIFIFIDQDILIDKIEQIDFPLIALEYEENLNSTLFKLFKKADINAVNYFKIINKNEFNLSPLSKGSPTINKEENKNLPDKIEKKNLINFVGRRTDISDVIRKIKDANGKIITIKGSGGIGKTTLIKKVAVEFAERSYFKDGIEFLDCESINEYETFEKNIARSFNLENSFEFIEYIKEHQTKLNSLIILDNFESILAIEDVDRIKDLVTFISNYVTIVVTSRQWIGFDFEEKHELRNFTTDEAYNLFKKNYNSRINPKDEKILKEEILEKLLNNNPLAIKIITKNLPKSSDFIALKNELSEDFFRTTDNGSVDIYDNETDRNIERSESLYHSINYSYVRLNSKERLVFEILSLFPNGIPLEAFKKFFRTEEFRKDLYKITNKDIKSLEDKSLIEINGGFINLQSIIGRFADAQLSKRDKSEKKRYYNRAYEFNSYILTLIEEIKQSNRVKALRVMDNTEDNFIKSLEYLSHVEEEIETLIFYIIKISQYFNDIGQERKFARNLVKSNEIFEQELNGNKLQDALYFSLIYFDGDFENSFEYISKNLNLAIIDNLEEETIDVVKEYLTLTIINIYCLEGYEFEVLRFLKENKVYYLEIHDILFRLGYFEFITDETEMKEDFFYYDLLYNIGKVSIEKLSDYLNNRVYNKEYIEIVQTNYVKTKMGFNSKEDIEPLVVTNPFTVGLKNLMLALVEENRDKKSILFESSIEKLYHIKYYYVEAILYYCEYLYSINSNDFSLWYELGRGLSVNHKYGFLTFKFESIVKNEIMFYEEEKYIDPNDRDIIAEFKKEIKVNV